MAAGSETVSCAKYNVARRCYGCDRPLRIKDEMALWFVGHPHRAVYGACCMSMAAHILEERKAA